MTVRQYVLGQLAQECAEVAHRASKAQHFGMDEIEPGQALTNRVRLQGELDDLIAVAEMLDLDIRPSNETRHAKHAKVTRMLGYARELGQVGA